MTSPQEAFRTVVESLDRLRRELHTSIAERDGMLAGNPLTAAGNRPQDWRELRDYVAARQGMVSISPVVQAMTKGLNFVLVQLAFGHARNIREELNDAAFRETNQAQWNLDIARYEIGHPRLSLARMRTPPGELTVVQRLDAAIAAQQRIDETSAEIATCEERIGRTVAETLGLDTNGDVVALARDVKRVNEALSLLSAAPPSAPGAAPGRGATDTFGPGGDAAAGQAI